MGYNGRVPLGVNVHLLPVESIFQESYNFAGETGSKLNVR